MDSLGDRMKAYEKSYEQVFPPVLPILVRIDGKAFHSFTKKYNFEKPFSIPLRERMIEAASYVISDMMNFKVAYIQSDEITLIMVLDRFESQHWFGGKKQKIESVSASLATAGFNYYSDPAAFDARAFSLPFHEVLNNLLWRMQDAERNAIQMIARHYYSHQALDGKNQNQMLEMLEQDHGVSPGDYSLHFTMGTVMTSPNTSTASPAVSIIENRKWWANTIFGDCVYVQEHLNHL